MKLPRSSIDDHVEIVAVAQPQVVGFAARVAFRFGLPGFFDQALRPLQTLFVDVTKRRKLNSANPQQIADQAGSPPAGSDEADAQRIIPYRSRWTFAEEPDHAYAGDTEHALSRFERIEQPRLQIDRARLRASGSPW